MVPGFRRGDTGGKARQARAGIVSRWDSLNASGVMIWVMMKAIGQAVMKLSGQWDRKPGPTEMNPMIPDMEKAMPKVMKSWARKTVFLGMWAPSEKGLTEKSRVSTIFKGLKAWCLWDADASKPHCCGAGIPTGDVFSAEIDLGGGSARGKARMRMGGLRRRGWRKNEKSYQADDSGPAPCQSSADGLKWI